MNLKINKHEKGQGVIEYASIIVLVVIVLAIVSVVCGPAIQKIGQEIAWAAGWSSFESVATTSETTMMQEYLVAQVDGVSYFSELPFSDHCFSNKHLPYDCAAVAEIFDKGSDGGCMPQFKGCPAHNKNIFYCEYDGGIIGMVVSTVNQVVITAFMEDIPGYWKEQSCK